MAHCTLSRLRKILLLSALLLFAAPHEIMAEPPSAAVAAFNSYVNAVESRLARQHRTPSAFLAPVDLRDGEFAVERLASGSSTALPGAMIHHWRGTAFIPGASAASFERLLRSFDAYPREFSPQVLQAKVLTDKGDYLQAWMRIRQQHIITVTMDAAYDVSFGRLDSGHRYSISRSTKISEIDADGRALTPGQEHGFLWRLNTYWTYEERDGGLYIQIESVSLTRSIPAGLGWAVGPFVESIPRESLEFTLRSAAAALRNTADCGSK